MSTPKDAVQPHRAVTFRKLFDLECKPLRGDGRIRNPWSRRCVKTKRPLGKDVIQTAAMLVAGRRLPTCPHPALEYSSSGCTADKYRVAAVRDLRAWAAWADKHAGQRPRVAPLKARARGQAQPLQNPDAQAEMLELHQALLNARKERNVYKSNLDAARQQAAMLQQAMLQ